MRWFASKVKRGDAVVFNFPEGDTVYHAAGFESANPYYDIKRKNAWDPPYNAIVFDDGSGGYTRITTGEIMNDPVNYPMVVHPVAGALIDWVDLSENTQLGLSYGRTTNGGTTWGVFTSPTPNASNSSVSYVDYADKPDVTMPAGFYTSSLTVDITTNEPNSVIRYTLDGALPTSSSPVYIAPLTFAATTVLKAVTFSNDPQILPSFIEFDTYFVNISHTLRVVSITGNQLTDLANGNGSLVPYGSFEYFDKNLQRKAKTYGEFNRHGQDTWANSQRSLDFVSRDEMGYNYAIMEKMYEASVRDKFQRVILLAAGDDNYPADHHTANLGSAHVRDAYIQNMAYCRFIPGEFLMSNFVGISYTTECHRQ